MGILTSSDSLPVRKAATFLNNHHLVLGSLAFTAGVLWFLALAYDDLNGEVYFSENALQPGLVQSTFNLGQLTRRIRREMPKSVHLPATWLHDQLASVGLETHEQNFSVQMPYRSGPNQVLSGINVYGIVRAPRIGSTESIVIAVPWRTVTDVLNAPAVAAAISMMAHFKRQAYWAKDLVLVIVDQNWLGMHAWLDEYQQSTISTYVSGSTLPSRAGSIQAALCLEFTRDTFSEVDVLIEGINGQVPNLDLVNLVSAMARQEQTPTTFHGLGSEYHAQPFDNYLSKLRTMLVGAAYQASCLPSGIHGIFTRYRIDAVTLRGVSGSHHAKDLGDLARIVEATLRSVNNLLERFHQSFFFYLLPGNGRYVSIGLYMPPMGLLLLAPLIRVLVLWMNLVKGQAAELKPDRTPVAFSSSPLHFGRILLVGVIVIISGITSFLSPSLTAAVLSRIPSLALTLPFSAPLSPIIVMTASLIVAPRVIRGTFTIENDLEKERFCTLLLCVSLVGGVMAFGTLSLLNVPLAAFFSLLFVLASQLVTAQRPQIPFHIIQCVLVLTAMCPPNVLSIGILIKHYLLRSSSSFDLQVFAMEVWNVWQTSLDYHHLVGVWLFPLATLLLWPLCLLFWCLLWCRTKPSSAHEHTD